MFISRDAKTGKPRLLSPGNKEEAIGEIDESKIVRFNGPVEKPNPEALTLEDFIREHYPEWAPEYEHHAAAMFMRICKYQNLVFDWTGLASEIKVVSYDELD